jgi:hypothetical protein
MESFLADNLDYVNGLTAEIILIFPMFRNIPNGNFRRMFRQYFVVLSSPVIPLTEKDHK